MTTPQAVRDIIDAAGGRLNGRTRLQKSAYFLEAAEAGAGFDFSYHYYGPYSEDLATAANDAAALKMIDVDWEKTQSGLQYAVYSSSAARTEDNTSAKQRRMQVLSVLNRYDAVSLELAATAHFLARSGYKDSWSETRRRKSVKATPERIEKAKRLLTELGH